MLALMPSAVRRQVARFMLHPKTLGFNGSRAMPPSKEKLERPIVADRVATI